MANDRRRIIIFGFPHCGTSILKSILGHIKSVHEIVDETDKVSKLNPNYVYTLCKYPYTLDKFFTLSYNGYIKIFVLRNPLYVFSSLNKRFQYDIPEKVQTKRYIETVKLFLQHRSEKKGDIYFIRYEDIFDDNYRTLREILDKIGFDYDHSIFNNSLYVNRILSKVNIPKEKPDNTDHGRYRTYQINQPFVNNNNPEKIDLSDEQVNTLTQDENILELYPDIKKCLLK